MTTGLIWREEEKDRELMDERMKGKCRKEDEEGEKESKYGGSLGEKRTRQSEDNEKGWKENVEEIKRKKNETERGGN